MNIEDLGDEEFLAQIKKRDCLAPLSPTEYERFVKYADSPAFQKIIDDAIERGKRDLAELENNPSATPYIPSDLYFIRHAA